MQLSFHKIKKTTKTKNKQKQCINCENMGHKGVGREVGNRDR